MAFELSLQCNLVYRFLKCAFPEDTADVDLKVYTLEGIHKFKKDYKSQSTKCGEKRYNHIPPKGENGRIHVPKQAISTPNANKTYQP